MDPDTRDTRTGLSVPPQALLDEISRIPSISQKRELQAAAPPTRTAGAAPFVATRTAASSAEFDFPDWFTEMSITTLDQFGEAIKGARRPANLSKLSASLQEYYMTEDVLYVLRGLPGSYITPTVYTSRKVSFSVDATIPAPLRELATRILPRAESYHVVARYIASGIESMRGRVVNAFAAALRELIEDWGRLIERLSAKHGEGRLALQALEVELAEPGTVLDAAAAVCFEASAEGASGGALLSKLQTRLETAVGAPVREMSRFLFMSAATPYMKTLAKWLFHGELDDPFAEFLVCEDRSVSHHSVRAFAEGYWTGRFQLFPPEQTPKFLLGIRDEILSAGKQQDVLHACGLKFVALDVGGVPQRDSSDDMFSPPPTPQLPLDPDDTRPLEAMVSRVNRKVSQELLRHFLDSPRSLQAPKGCPPVDLRGHFRALRMYFLMQAGDFFAAFLDSAAPELDKKRSDCSITHLDGLLGLAIRTSTAASRDPHHERLSVALFPVSFPTMLQRILEIDGAAKAERHAPASSGALLGHSALCLEYKVEWPLSLVLTKRALTKYQLLFRRLLNLRVVERKLEQSWSLLMSLREIDNRRLYVVNYMLHSQMLHFIKALQMYMDGVISRRSADFDAEIRQASELEDVMRAHGVYLNDLFRLCFLRDQAVVTILDKLFVQCLVFSQHLSKKITTLRTDPSGRSLGGKIGMMHDPLLGPRASTGGRDSDEDYVGTKETRRERLEVIREIFAVSAPHENASVLRLRAGFEKEVQRLQLALLDHTLNEDSRHGLSALLGDLLDFSGYYQDTR
eukprot:gnl/Chilomastix_cuspidata/200.p1 GENE.gnl/Chilomastix_cuspidata/200~~gnl/Chilomastix_cuspidata/200.p1  ORF type:complete len:798 (-),score=340.12 gnl/Chilomastix_cuspidata/200:659-3052(-)